MVHQGPGVEGLPRLRGGAGAEVLVELDQGVDQLAANRGGAQLRRQLGEMDQPVRVPGSPVRILAVDDAIHPMVRLTRLFEQGADRRDPVVHWPSSDRIW